MRACLLFVLLLAMPILPAQAATQTRHADTVYIPGTHFGIKEGLPSPNTNGITQTPDKLLWISTEEGLVRYDGVAFTTIQKGDVDGDDFPSNTLNSVMATDDGQLWLAFSNAGVGLYNPATRQIRLFGVRGQGQRALMGDDVWHFASDRQGRIWMMEYGEGFSVWDPVTEQMQHIPAKTTNTDSWLPSNQLFDFFIDRDNVLWAVTLDSQVIRHDLNTGDTSAFDLRMKPDDPFSNPMYTVRHIHGTLYAGGYNGLFAYLPDKKQFKPVFKRQDMPKIGSNWQSVMSLMGDRYGGLWIGTTDGLLYWSQGHVSPVSLFEFGQLLPLRDTLMGLYQDHEGGIWVLADSNGIFKLSTHWDQFAYFLPFTEEDRLAGNHIRVLAPAANAGNFWLAYVKGKRLDKVKLSRRGFELIEQSLDNPDIPSRPLSLHDDHRGNLWLGALNGLHRLRPDKHFSATRLDLPKNLASAPLVGRVPSLQQQAHRLWLTVFDAEHPAFVDLNQQPARIQPFLPVTFNPREGEQRLLPAPGDKTNRLWLLSPSHLRELNTETGTLRELFGGQLSLQDFSFRPGSNRVWGLIDGQPRAFRWQGNALLATPEENPLTGKSNLPRAFYTRIQEDQHGKLWLGSNVGLLQVDLATGDWRFYTESEGLPSREITDIQLTESGHALIATKWGLVTPNPQYQPQPPTKPQLALHGIFHGDKMLPGKQTIVLPHDYGVLRLEYAVLSFNNPQANRYFYRLDPNAPWQRADGPQLSLMQLPPGQYSLQIKGQTADGQESKPLNIDLAILPPPWRSQAAYTLYAVLIVAALALAAWLWRRKINRDFALRHADEKREFAENQLALTRSLVSSLDFNTVLQRVVEQIQQRVRADDVLLLLWDNESGQYAVASSTGSPPEPQALESLKALHPAVAEEGENKVLQLHQGKQHSLIVPFTSASHDFGLLRLQRSDRPFSQRHKALLQAYAAQASVALENARLFSEVQRLAKKANAASQAKSDFLARVSHEVRTPLNGVLGMAELLLDSPLNDEQKLYAEAIQRSGEHLLGIINDILDLSKIEAGKLQLETADFDLLIVLEDVVQLFAPVARKNRIALYFVLDPNLARCRHGDALRLKQILFNLLSNAIKFTKRGHIVVRAKADPNNPDQVHFTVEDSGIGIKNETAKTLFEPFVQADNATSRKYGGTGLGLAIARQLVEKMRGRIQAHGTPGVGSRFTFSAYLPVCDHTEMPTSSCPDVCIAVLTNSPHVKAQIDNALVWCRLRQAKTATEADWLLVDASRPLTPEDIATMQAIDRSKTRLVALVYDDHDSQSLSPWLSADSHCLHLPLTPRSLRQLLRNEQTVLNQPTQPSQAPAATTHTKVLVVEDNPINHQVATEMLEKAGYVVDVVESAEEAMARIRDENYDIILSDYHLPDLNGIDMARQLARHQIQRGQEPTPVILVTADLTDDTWRKAAAAGIRSLLPKPFSQDSLTRAINSVLANA